MRTFPLLALAGALASAPALAAEQPAHQATFPDTTALQLPPAVVILPEFAQANPLWGEIRFKGRRTLGEKGCTIFASLIAIHSLGYETSPTEFTKQLVALGSFTPNGELIWERIAHVAPVKADRRTETGPQAIRERVRIALVMGSRAALRLRTPWTREHWIAVVGMEGDDFVVVDPAGGKRARFRDLYADAHLTGATVFTRTPPLVLASAR